MATAMEKCTTCSNNSSTRRIKANGFQITKDTCKKYFYNVVVEWRKHRSLPGIQDKVTWSVHKLSPSGVFKHFSLLFVREDKAYNGSPGFTFELTYTKVNMCSHMSYYEVIPQTLFKPANPSMSKLGTFKGSAKAIMNLGLKCLSEFGDYDYLSHNCQHFCCQFAKKLPGVEEPWTDNKKVGVTAGLVAVGLGVLGAAGLAIGVLSSVLGGGRSDNDDFDDDDNTD